MAAIPKYVFLIIDSSGNQYEFERATKKAYEVYENDVGRCRFFVPYNDLKLSTTSIPDNKWSEIRIFREASLVWQGITQIVQDTKDGTWVFGETFLAALQWYGVRYDQAHSNVNLSSLISDEYDNIVGRDNDFLAAKITKGTIQNPYQSGTTNDLKVTRILWNENFYRVLLQLTYVARAEMTTSWDQNTVFDISFSETASTFTVTRDVGTDKSDVIFELDSEILEVTIPRDFRSIENEHKGFAIAAGPSILTSADSDATSQGNFYRREYYPFYNNVNNQTDLDKRVDNRNEEKKDPLRTLRLKFAAGLIPFNGYSLGDRVKLRVSRGRISIDEFRRVIGMRVGIDASGVEQTVPLLQKARS